MGKHESGEKLRVKEVTPKEDVYISDDLPLAHIFDRTVEEFMIYEGAKIDFWQAVCICFLLLITWQQAGVIGRLFKTVSLAPYTLSGAIRPVSS
ncbi:hypothetical protein CBR_g57895 [Chara braunii]|uniref:Uncharacterized protein n=2 Tax=Chara braunii TaxID=69332 RepID=A0A388MEE6_CHABU|nr:hypothetical protein CBR_g57895 [Chara braunii]|eukprot:GBG92938.1 hypothetical protein CBR_g57895 [Chara braunii]